MRYDMGLSAETYVWSVDQTVSMSCDKCSKLHHYTNVIQYQWLGVSTIHPLSSVHHDVDHIAVLSLVQTSYCFCINVSFDVIH